MRVAAENIACVRGGRQVFADLSFSVGESEALVVTGPNGAGKSSLLRVIAGLVRIARGRLILEAGADATIGEQAHYVGHLDAIKGALTVAENLRFWASYLGGTSNVPGALEAVELAGLADVPGSYLSAGQKRRLSIARLIAIRRPIWLLDEPASALDTDSQTTLAELMRTHLAGGGLIVAASHGPIGIPNARELRLGTA